MVGLKMLLAKTKRWFEGWSGFRGCLHHGSSWSNIQSLGPGDFKACQQAMQCQRNNRQKTLPGKRNGEALQSLKTARQVVCQILNPIRSGFQKVEAVQKNKSSASFLPFIGWSFDGLLHVYDFLFKGRIRPKR